MDGSEYAVSNFKSLKETIDIKNYLKLTYIVLFKRGVSASYLSGLPVRLYLVQSALIIATAITAITFLMNVYGGPARKNVISIMDDYSYKIQNLIYSQNNEKAKVYLQDLLGKVKDGKNKLRKEDDEYITYSTFIKFVTPFVYPFIILFSAYVFGKCAVPKTEITRRSQASDSFSMIVSAVYTITTIVLLPMQLIAARYNYVYKVWDYTKLLYIDLTFLNESAFNTIREMDTEIDNQLHRVFKLAAIYHRISMSQIICISILIAATIAFRLYIVTKISWRRYLPSFVIAYLTYRTVSVIFIVITSVVLLSN